MLSSRSLLLLLAFTGLAPLLFSSGQSDAYRQVRGKVVDGEGKPVALAMVAQTWTWSAEGMTATTKAVTDGAGEFNLRVRSEFMPISVLALDQHGKRGGIALFYQQHFAKRLTIKLTPMVPVKGEIFCAETKTVPAKYEIRINHNQARRNVLIATLTKKKFSFLLPPMAYRLNFVAGEYQPQTWPLRLTDAPTGKDMGQLTVSPNTLGRQLGKEAPPWNITAADGATPGVQPTDYLGKWVLLYFWSHKDHNSARVYMPHLIKLYNANTDYRNWFEVLAIHNRDADSLGGLYDQIDWLAQNFWENQRLPFPLLLDATGKTHNDYGVEQMPKYVIIDPTGKIAAKPSRERFAEIIAELVPQARKANSWSKRLKETKKRSQLKTTFKGLGHQKPDIIRKVLLDYLAGEIPVTSARMAIPILGKAGGRPAATFLCRDKWLGAKDLKIRLATIAALVEIGDDRATAPLCKLLTTPDSPTKLLKPLCLAIGTLAPKSPEAIAAIRNLTNHGDAKIRLTAVTTLGEMAAPAVVETLIVTLNNDRSGNVRAAAARALGKVEAKEALPHLEKAATADKSRAVKKAAAKALKKLR